MNTCKTCRLPAKDLQIVNLALLSGISLRHISARFPIGTSSLKRHKDQHIPKQMAKAKEAAAALRADEILAEAQHRRAKINELFEIAATSEPVLHDETLAIKAIKGDREFALRAVRAAKDYDELLLRARGEWRERLGLDLAGDLSGLSPEEHRRWKRLVAAVYETVPNRGDEIMEKAGIDLEIES